MSLTRKTLLRLSSNIDKDHLRMSVHHPSKYEVDSTNGLGGVWTHTHTQTGGGAKAVIE